MNVLKKFIVPALALGMLAACSDDNKFDGPAEETNETSRVQYLNISISGGDALGRAGNDADYDDGVDDESKIKSVYLVFYDAAGQFVTSVGPKNVGTNDDEFVDGGNDPFNVEKILNATVAIELEKGAADPAFVMCYINPIQTGSTATGDGANDNASLNTATIGEIKNIKRTEVFKTENSTKYFGMSNSVYYKDGDLVRATPIPAGALKLKKEEINDETPSVTIHVERYAAKVKVSYNEAQNDPATVGAYKLKFNVENWYLNAREKEYFVSKSFTKTVNGNGIGAMGAENAPFTGTGSLSEQLSHWTTWNAPELYRSFWARSVSYFSSNYPDVSDDITETSNYLVDYFSYNKITQGSDKVGLTSGNAIYARENTIGGNALNGATNTLAALSSVVLVGKYSLDGYDENTTFYVKEKNVYFKPEDAKEGDLTIYKGLLQNNNTLMVQTSEETENAEAGYAFVDGDENDAVMNLFEIYHPFGKTESAVSVRIKKSVTDPELAAAKLYYVISGVRKKLTTADVEAMNNLLFANIGTMDAYTDGMAYFSIPIRHLGWQRNGNANKDSETINWSLVKEGDFGIVRNHSYNINITSFGAGLGSGIFDPNKPIVPEKSKTTWYGKYDLRILSWRVVPTQDVKL